ncbi:MAG: glycoside hydrolase family 3 C-terminal domain-containing protein [Bacteroidales bacterium]|nr:glycoside hydrolase family 3 C-terminal domain-containing protein [Bacteroidales bacterium]
MKLKLLASVLACGLCLSAQALPYVIGPSDVARAKEIVSKMTIEEKVDLISGQVDGFWTASIERLGVPAVRMADGPQGVRNKTKSTYYPCGILVASSFNREAANGVGLGIGFDATARGVRIMLCPGVNIYRTALCGRNFEYYGEDPYLAGEIASNYIRGIQERRVIATIKHFCTNNQEYARHKVSSNVDERTLNEIYFPAFRKAVEQAGVGAVMTSYNPVNGEHAAESSWLIKDNLRKWGFEGIVMSDWVSTYTILGTLTSGLDLEMPKAAAIVLDEVKTLIANGVVRESDIDLMCQHILQTFSAFGLLDKPMKDESIPEDYEFSRNMAYNASVEGPVLLTNNGILPLKASSKTRIAVLGPNADVVAFGGGSGAMHPIDGRNITLRAGLEGLGKGYKAEYFDCNNLSDADMKAIVKASAVVLSVGFNNKTETENSDRTYALPEGQNELIAKIAAVNPNVVVVVNSGGEVDINPWKDNVAAIIMAWYGGQEGGRALADIIAGKVAPSGKLPFTFWGTLEKNPAYAYYPQRTPAISVKNANRDPYPYAVYSEGVFVGYRGVKHFGVEPMFPFGHGLSYVGFAYSNLSVTPSGDGFDVRFTVKNTGNRAAAEAAQVYVSPECASLPRPDQELKGFDKKKIAAGKTAEYCIHLGPDAFSHYDVVSHSWKTDSGKYTIRVGASSADIRLTSSVTL